MGDSDRRDVEAVLEALRRRREEIEAWLDGPAKQATLASIDHMIAEQERSRLQKAS